MRFLILPKQALPEKVHLRRTRFTFTLLLSVLLIHLFIHHVPQGESVIVSLCLMGLFLSLAYVLSGYGMRALKAIYSYGINQFLINRGEK
jgi:hydrogenase/urease accessory protein HupE